MRIKNLKGVYEVSIEDPYDLWVLYRILRKKKFEIGCHTLRTIKFDSKESKIKAFVFIEGEKVKLEGDKIRITGKIKGSSNEEVPLGVYHSIDVVVGKDYKIKTNFSNWEIEAIKKAIVPKKMITIAIFDFGDTIIYELSNKLKEVEEIKENLPGKEDPNYSKRREQYINKVIKELSKRSNLVIGAHSIVIDLLKKKINAIFVPIGNTGKRGVYEIIKRGIIKEIEKENRISNETLEVEKFLSKVGTKETVYGKDEVKKYLEWKAIDKILVSEDLLFNDEETQKIIEEADKNNIRIVIISSDHEAGEQFKHFGIAAFLRYHI